MKEAKYYEQLLKNEVKCQLCPHNCIITQNNSGLCQCRINIDGKLYANNYGKIVLMDSTFGEDINIDKDFYNSQFLSIASVGCNLKCDFCQNHQISHNSIDNFNEGDIKSLEPNELISYVLKDKKNEGIAFAYTEAITWYEYMLEVCQLAKENGLKTLMCSNGFINEEALKELNKYIDIYNIGLKSYDGYLYEKLTLGKLEPVIKNIEFLTKSGKHIELDYLLIPTYNDNPEKFEELVKNISLNFGSSVPLHIIRYYPKHKLHHPMTNMHVLYEFEDIAKKHLKYVFLK